MDYEHGIAMAKDASGHSADPSTKTGCAIFDSAGSLLALGYNRLAPGMSYGDCEARPDRLSLTIHAEVHALAVKGWSARGCSVFVYPWPPCAPCASLLAWAGVERVVAPRPSPDQLERWGDSWRLAELVYERSGVEFVLL